MKHKATRRCAPRRCAPPTAPIKGLLPEDERPAVAARWQALLDGGNIQELIAARCCLFSHRSEQFWEDRAA